MIYGADALGLKKEDLDKLIASVKRKVKTNGFAVVQVEISRGLQEDFCVSFPIGYENDPIVEVVKMMLTIDTGFIVQESFSLLETNLKELVADPKNKTKFIKIVFNEKLLPLKEIANERGETRLQECFRYLVHGITGAVRD